MQSTAKVVMPSNVECFCRAPEWLSEAAERACPLRVLH
jgi:hypothetical protein